ncbi:MAG: putative metal-binding motif-containing protein [Desulfuromonadaceae bacterium]
MKRMIKVAMVGTALLSVTLLVSMAEARRSFLDGVNATCGTSYNCGLCHVDPRGGGPLTAAGQGYLDSGSDSCYFCVTSPTCTTATPTCTDRDGDGYFAEGGTCGPADCNDTDASIHPGACDVLKDGIDQDCSGADRSKGKACR